MPTAEALREEFDRELGAAVTSAGIDTIRVKYLGKKGLITQELKKLSSLTAEERRLKGAALNALKQHIEAETSARMSVLKDEELRARLAREGIDVTLPGRPSPLGRLHPITQAMEDMAGIFIAMGFGVEEGPEVETDFNNFEALNMPKDHPARDMQDTFYISDETVMRTHTSPVQIRVMSRRKPPFRVIAPGRVYRCDADVTHSPMFHQVEGFMVGTDISFANLKGVLEEFIHRYFGHEIPVRFRPGFFPFTEPSAEIDIGCIFCLNRGCRICKTTGWLEILGAGMINPRVFEKVGYNPAQSTGFAFGMGVERIAMLKYCIDDIRLFFDNDLRFLRQF